MKLGILIKGGLGDQLKHLLGGLYLAKMTGRNLEAYIHPHLLNKETVLSFFPKITRGNQKVLEEVFFAEGVSLSEEWFDGKGDRADIHCTEGGTPSLVIRNPNSASNGFLKGISFCEEFRDFPNIILCGSRIEYQEWIDLPVHYICFMKLLKEAEPYLDFPEIPGVAVTVRRGDRVNLGSYPSLPLEKTIRVIKELASKHPSLTVFSDSPQDIRGYLPPHIPVVKGPSIIGDVLQIAGHSSIYSCAFSGYSQVARILRGLKGLETSFKVFY